MTNFLLKMILIKPELTGRMEKWSIRYSTYEIVYTARTTIKSQSLADFVADFSPIQATQAEEELQHIMTNQDVKIWCLFIDKASNVNGTGIGIVLKLPKGDT